MLYLAFIFHMHQPYYRNLLTGESPSPWVRLHATKDYSDMVLILEKFPKIKQVFNLVPSLLEQIEDYAKDELKDYYQLLSYKKIDELTPAEKDFIYHNFFKINPEKVIFLFPRYYQLYLKMVNEESFSNQDYLDTVVWFNLVWIDPYFRQNIPQLKELVRKARFFSEEDKITVLEIQKKIVADTICVYKKFSESGQIEISITPYYHPILPLLYNTKTALDANPKTAIPKEKIFHYPQDAQAQINNAVKFFKERFGRAPAGMWPSEQAVSQHILPFIAQAGINWIVTEEALLFKSLRRRRTGKLLYQPYLLEVKGERLNIVFRDRNLSDMIGFVYHRWRTEDAVNDFMYHLENIAKSFGSQDCLVSIAMDGENAWEYYLNDGHNFLQALYERLSEAKFLKTTTISEYLNTHPAKSALKKLKPGSWINCDFTKWIGNPYKNKAWGYLTDARKILQQIKDTLPEEKQALAWKQMYILEGSDWFWWYGEQNPEFDMLFRMHLSGFYRIIGQEVPAYLNSPLEP